MKAIALIITFVVAVGALAAFILGFRPNVPPAKKPLVGSQSNLPGPYDQSEYMIGSVTVTAIYPESNGSLDRDTENWDSARLTLINTKIRSALDWWESQMPNGHLSFLIENLGVRETRYEPISRPLAHEALWIGEILGDLGYNATDWFSKVRDLNNRMRSLHHTSWAYTIFIVDSRNDSDGSFEDGKFAYANYGGPVIVMTTDNGGWGIERIDNVVAHETGHVFYATDEYGMVGESSGYLDIKETDNSGCLMDASSWCLSPGTRGQIGWIDSDGDGLMDPEDTTPQVMLDSPRPLTNATFQLNGFAEEVALPNRNPKSYTGDNVSINIIVAIQYQVDGGRWISVSPIDLIFDEAEEGFELTVGPLPFGNHSMQVRAENSVGNWGASAITVTANDGDVQLPSSGEVNYNPLVAAIFVLFLTIFGLWSSRRRPWKGELGRKTVTKAFMVASLPFILAEALAGIASFLTGQLTIPPPAGFGTAVDLAILLIVLAIAGLRTSRPRTSRAEEPEAGENR